VTGTDDAKKKHYPQNHSSKPIDFFKGLSPKTAYTPPPLAPKTPKIKMLKIGAHLSINNGYLSAAKEAKSIEANCFQYFSRNPRGGTAREVDLSDISTFNDFAAKNDLFPVLAHAPYTLNLASANPDTRKFAHMCIRDDIKTLSNFKGNNNYVFHPGSHTTLTREEGLAFIIDILNSVLSPQTEPKILLEAMSGKGSELGTSFNELKFILDRVEQKSKMGVCLDTCHIFCAGYDIVNNLDGVLEEFDNLIGLDKIYAVHLNDSLYPLGAKKDRHSKIGAGEIGLDAIVKFINHPSLKHLPYYLETPNDTNGYLDEILLLRKNFNNA